MESIYFGDKTSYNLMEPSNEHVKNKFLWKGENEIAYTGPKWGLYKKLKLILL